MSGPRISVIGSGYVGLITGILFSKKGFETVCIEVIQEKVDAINQGIPPFFESARPLEKGPRLMNMVSI